MHFVNAGDCEMPHSHCHDHLTLLTKGRIRVTVNGKTSEFSAPHMIYVQAEQLHTLTALEDDTIAHCIHALRDGDRVEDIIDPSMIPAGGRPHDTVQIASSPESWMDPEFRR